MLWSAFPQCVQKAFDLLGCDFDRCLFSFLFGRLSLRPVPCADSSGKWASALSSMVSPIDRGQISFDKIVLIGSSSLNLGELFVNVVQKISQLGGKLERSARALISSSKFNPWEESLANTRLKVLIWEFACYDSFIFI